jgi:hypothetical protein
MLEMAPEDLPACDLLAILVILRGAKERIDAEKRSPAPVLQLMPAVCRARRTP